MDHPMEYADFHALWQMMQGTANPEDAYDAYLSGLGESLQHAAMCCEPGEVGGYVDKITSVVHMRRSHYQGLHHSTQNLKKALGDAD